MTLRPALNRLVCYLTVLILSTQLSVAAPQAFEQYTVLAALTLNFARFTQWAEQSFAEPGDKLNICLVGENAIQESFESISGKAVGGKIVKIIDAGRLRNLTQCQVIFVSELPRNLLLQVLLDIKGHQILTISEDREFVEEGGMVSMVNENGKINLYVNLAAVRGAGLTISSNLLKLAKIVGESAGK